MERVVRALVIVGAAAVVMALSLSPGGQPGRIFWLALASGRRDRGRAAGLAHGV